MSKIDKKDLARGTKLTPEHVWDNNLDGVITNINNADQGDGLIQPQYKEGNGTFRLTWNIPWIGADWTKNNGLERPYVIPFCLLPLQEFIRFNTATDHNTPQVVMTEFSYGFDQRDEGGLITDPTCGPGLIPLPTGGSDQTWSEYMRTLNTPYISEPDDWTKFFTNQNHGKMHNDIATRGDLKFSVLQKSMGYFDASAPLTPTDNLYDLTVPMAALIGRDLRLNPHFEKDLNIIMDPYSSYFLGITPPQLDDTAVGTKDNLALVNLTVSIKFMHKLVNRDSVASVADPLFIPDHGGLKTPDTLAVTKPLVDTVIEADTADGLNTTITAIDEKFGDKLKSGYDKSLNSPAIEHLIQDAGYEVIAIPLWNNQFSNRVTYRDTINGLQAFNVGGRWGAGGRFAIPSNAPSQTRAIVPIDYPFAIHHVVLAANIFTADFVSKANPLTTEWHGDAWDTALGQQAVPSDYTGPNHTDAQIFHEIGIGVGTGNKGAKYGYRQMLHYQDLQLSKDSDSAFELDRVKMYYPSTNNTETIANRPNQPNWKLLYLPLDRFVGTAPGLYNRTGTKAGGASQFTSQDPPHFVGQSFINRDEDNPPAAGVPVIGNYDGTSVRHNDPAGAVFGLGGDQWIEVRWSTLLKTDAGVTLGWDTVTVPVIGSGDESKIVHGYGGHWLYLIGKKHTVSNANWQSTNLKGGM